MKRIFTIFILVTLCLGCHSPNKEHKTKPNIIFILADDLGFGETGVYGQEKIETPSIDALAKNGMLFTQHYAGSPVCAPSRYVLLTGKHTGHGIIRGNDEWVERGDVWDYKKASADYRLEGQRPIPDSTMTIAEVLKDTGYKTAIIGKWGLGAPATEGTPNKQGFDYFYGYNCQRQAHNLYPPHLWENDKKIPLNNQIIAPKTKLDDLADPYDEKSYLKFQQQEYAPDLMIEKAQEFISKNRKNPFFMYFASPLPHLPLQAPKRLVEKYKKKFGNEEPYQGQTGYFPNRYPRATYAAMITALDEHVGKLIQTLKNEGIYNNTIIIFSSDNGPSFPKGGVDIEYFNSAKPFINQEGRTKAYVYEGGIRVPLIVSWPNRIKAESKSNQLSAFYDFFPTICEIAGKQPPNDIDGISLLPMLLGQDQKIHDFLYWEFPDYSGQQAVRLGKWKGIRKNIFEGNMDIELYNLDEDLAEQKNIALQHPEIIDQIKKIMEQEHTPSPTQELFN